MFLEHLLCPLPHFLLSPARALYSLPLSSRPFLLVYRMLSVSTGLTPSFFAHAPQSLVPKI